ncbi:hypothetical protein WJX75_003265 [Coccomyxa subellipsoidea]|uniref:HRDC domain-containing protein n=1 Tax=Coccomyxa subellipsoidea TaxID=248742 RepID=A0ABR2YME0_9CHLO
MPHFGRPQDKALRVPTLLLGTLLISSWILRWVKRQRGSHGKPQAHFKKVLADNSDAPFEHRSRNGQVHGSSQAVEEGLDDGSADVYVHPFGREILQLIRDSSSSEASVRGVPASLPKPIACSEWDWIDTAEQLYNATQEFKRAQQVAVDLEHHALRSYLGITCLVQLSTGDKEYLIDALALHDHMHLLQDIMENAKILKVVHGGENDISWLQRDFHLYLVNVFDTEKACQVLGYEERSLAHLLQKHCRVTANKQHQRADWRIRPLAEESVEYARTDVHYLLYIAEVLRSELNKRAPDALEEACRRSQVMSLNLYSKPASQASVAGALNAVLRKHAAAADTSASGPRLVECVHVLCRWRDHVARQQDESLQYTMPDALLLSLATTPPRNSQDILERATHASCPWSTSAESVKLLKRHAAELCRLLEEAQLGMHPWQPGGGGLSAAAMGKQRRTAEEAAERRRKLVASFCAKSPVYENCRMLSMEGAPLSFIDLRKLQWYEARGLAERVGDNPPTIRLLFRHKAADQETGADAFYGERKLNCCVACGNTSNYLRYRVVPACYRRYFPVHLKSHRSHDVVLLCFDCHQIAHQAAERMKQSISREYGVPLLPPVPPPPEGAAAAGMPEKALHPTNIRRSALALQYHAASMPAERREKLTALVRAYVRGSTATAAGQQPLTGEELQEGLMAGFGARARRKHMQRHAAGLLAVAARDLNKGGHQWHGRKVVEAVLAKGGEEELCELMARFRQCFVDALHPQHLSPSWQIDHSAKRAFGDFSVYSSQQAAHELAMPVA